jgi:predicted phage terminase large subunit-like protein
MKSLLVAVFWPTWLWGPADKPHVQFLYGSYALQLATRDNLKRRRLIQSPYYQKRWGHVFQLTGDQNAKQRFENDHNGHCLITSPDSATTGEGGDIIIVDDPHNAKEAHSEAARLNVATWWNEGLISRHNDPKTGIRGIIAQRVHEADLCGLCIEDGGFVHLCLPAEYEPNHPYLSTADWRTEPGELLWPARFGAEQLAKLKKGLGSYGSAGQLQQRPAPAEGGIIKREWIRYWSALPPRFDLLIQSWDMAFKDSKAGSYVVGQVWGRLGADCYLLDQYRKKIDFTGTQAAVRAMSAKWPGATLKLIEDKANGPAIISSLNNEVGGMVAVLVKAGKEARASAVSPLFEAGNIWLPHTDWIADYVVEICTFPNAANDDQMDATSQALERLTMKATPWVPTATTATREA